MPIPTMLCASLLISGMPVAIQDPPRISRPQKPLSADALRVKLGKTELGSGEVKPTRNTKAPFAPIDTKEKLGRVPADTEEVTLNGNQKLKYGEYKKWRDGIETNLNELGFSLKDPGKVFKVRSASASEQNQLQEQRRQFLSEGTPGTLSRGVQDRFAVLDKFKIPGPGIVITPTKGNTPFRAKNIQITKTFNKQLGIDVANLALNADLNINGRVTNNSPATAQGIQDIDGEFHLVARGTATGKLLKKSFELARAEGAYDTNKKTDSVKMRASLFVAGQQVLNENKTLTGAQRRGETKRERSVEFSGTADIPVFGPIKVSAEFGVRGKAGIIAKYNLGGSTLNGEVNPFVDVDGFAEGAVGIGAGGFDLAKAGVHADITFARFDMKLGANVGLGVRNKDVLIFENAYWHNDLELLSGSMGVFVDIDFILATKRFETELFDFPGFKTSSFLLNQSKETVVGQVAG